MRLGWFYTDLIKNTNVRNPQFFYIFFISTEKNSMYDWALRSFLFLLKTFFSHFIEKLIEKKGKVLWFPIKTLKYE